MLTYPTRRALWRLVLAVSIAAAAAAPGRAQEVATSFDELRRVVGAGETIYVTDATGATVKGRVVDISASVLQLRIGDGGRQFSERDVNNIVAERRDSWWNGMLIGFGAGAGSGLLIELAGRGQYEKFSGAGAIGLGATGLAVGFLIDALNNDTVTLYVHAPSRHARRVSVAPLASKSAAGVRMSIAF